jgi:hypothetical protein
MIGWLQVPAVGEADVPELDERTRNQLLALDMFVDRQEDEGWEWGDWEALLELWDRESGWETRAANSVTTARGIPQAMASLYPDTWEPVWLHDPKRQIGWGMNYIKNRYGSPREALAFHDRNNSY